MVLYTTTSSAASGLANNTTYWVTYYNEPAGSSVPGFFQIKVAALPGGADITVSGGTGTQKFRKIGVSTDKDVFHIPFHNFTQGDMIKYSYPNGGAVAMTNRVSDYIYVGTVYDTYNVNFNLDTGLQATGGTITEVGGYKYHAFTTVGSSTFTVTGGEGTVEVLVVAGGGGGGGSHGGGGGGGGGGLVYHSAKAVTTGTYAVTVGDGGDPGRDYGSSTTGNYGASNNSHGKKGGNSTFGDITAIGGGGGNESFYTNSIFKDGGSGGGGGDYYTGVSSGGWLGGNAQQGNSGGGIGYGNPGGSRGPGGPTANEDGTHAQPHEGAGGGGAGGVPTGGNSSTPSNGGIGRQYTQFAAWGSPAGWFSGGGGGGWYYYGPHTKTNTNVGGYFGGGGKGADAGPGFDAGDLTGMAGVPNSGGGGGGGSGNNNGRWGFNKGGSGIVVLRYQA